MDAQYYPEMPGDPLPDPKHFSIDLASPKRAALLRRAREVAQTETQVHDRAGLIRIAEADNDFLDAVYYFMGIYEPIPEIPEGMARPLPGRTVDFDLDGRRIRPSNGT